MAQGSWMKTGVEENPRTTRVRRIVLDGAAELLIEEGHRAVTPHQVSKATGVARSTIYRHWPDPVSLLLDAIDSVLAPDHAVSTVGDIHVDLTSALESLRLRLNKRPFRAMFAALLDHATRSPRFVPAQRRFVSGVTAPLRSIIAEAIDDGRLAHSLVPDEAVAQLGGPIFHQHVMLLARISDDLITRTVDAFVLQNQKDGDAGGPERPAPSV
jgi:AcrR family transcriptional regulator